MADYDLDVESTSDADDASDVVEVAIKRLKLAKEAVDKQRTREQEALKFQVPELQWTDDMRQGRSGDTVAGVQLPPRPMISIPSLNQPIQLLQNQMRAAHMSVNITPLTEDAEDDTAEVIRDLYRREASRGGAETARFWGFDRAMKAGTGAYALDTCYDEESDNPFDQRVIWRRIWDGANVYFDPVIMEANPREMEYAFELKWMRHSKIRRDFKRSKLASYENDELRALAADEPEWVSFAEANDEPMCCVAVYWRKEYTEKTWVILDDGGFAYDDEIPDGRRLHTDPKVNRQRRTVQVPRVIRSLICGDEELEDPEEWNGKHIPLIPTIGIELQPFDTERRLHGIIEPAMGSQKLKNWAASTIIEGVASETKSPYLMWEGQDEGYEEMWRQAAVRNFPALKIKPVVGPNGELLPPPTKNQGDLGRIAPGIQLLQLADQFMQSATASIDQGHIEQMGRRRVAHQTIQSMQEQSDAGNSHYMINMQTVSMPYEAEVFLDLVPHIYDRPGRVLRLLDLEDEPKRPIMLNHPFRMDPRTKRPIPVDADGDGLPDGVKHYDLGKGRFAIAVQVGKGYQDRLQEGASEMTELIGGNPDMLTLLGPIALKFRPFPGAHEAAEILKRYRAMKFPGIDQDPDDPQGDPQMLQQENKALKAQMQQMGQMLETDGLKTQSQERIAAQKDQTTLEKARMDNEVKLAVAEIGAKMERMQLFLKERARVGMQQHDSALAASDAGHEEHMATLAHQQALQQGAMQAGQQAGSSAGQAEQSHRHAMEQGTQGHDQALEQQAQAAALAPQPEAGE